MYAQCIYISKQDPYKAHNGTDSIIPECSLIDNVIQFSLTISTFSVTDPFVKVPLRLIIGLDLQMI